MASQSDDSIVYETQVYSCERCGQKIRIPTGKSGRFSCKSCKTYYSTDGKHVVLSTQDVVNINKSANLAEHRVYKNTIKNASQPGLKTTQEGSNHNLKYYSYSRLNKFKKCPLAFKYQYIDEYEQEFDSTIEQYMGKCIHSTIEYAYNNASIIDLTTLISEFRNIWENDGLEQARVIKKGSNPNDYFNQGLDLLTYFFNEIFDLDEETIDNEREFMLKLGSRPINYKGIIDRLCWNDNGLIEIIDYKTGKSIPSISSDLQLRSYALHVFAEEETIDELKITIHDLRGKRPISSIISRTDAEKIEQQILKAIDIIENTTSFPAQRSPLCNWCGFNHYCSGAKSPIKKIQMSVQSETHQQTFNGLHPSIQQTPASLAFEKEKYNAEQGNKISQRLVGEMFQDGKGVIKDNTQAAIWFRKAAEQGDAAAQNWLGRMYADGRGVNQDKTEAFFLYRKAADQGFAVAQFNLGITYLNGQGIEGNDSQAIYWLRKAAAQYFSLAESWIGWMYENGRGVDKDSTEAFFWYRKSADQGYMVAQYSLAKMYWEGLGVTKNDGQAIFWCTKAAEQGHKDAQYKLGLMHEKGDKTEKCHEQAVFWYQKAAEQGHMEAQYKLANNRNYSPP